MADEHLSNQESSDGDDKVINAVKPDEKKGAPLSKTLLLICAFILILPVMILLLKRQELSKADPLLLVRKDTVLLISYDYLAYHQSGKGLSETYSRWKNTDPYRQAKSLLAQRTGLDADDDFLSWVGPRFCISSGANKDRKIRLDKCLDELPIVLIASVQDNEKLKETMDKIKRLYREKNGGEYREDHYKGADINVPDRKGSIHFSHCRQYFIVSTDEEGLKRAVDTLNKPGESIAVSREYRDFCNRLKKPRELTVFFNMSQWKSEISSAHIDNQKLLKILKSFGFGVVRDRDALTLDGIFLFDEKDSDGDMKKSIIASGRMSLPDYIPAELPLTVIVNSSSIPVIDALFSFISPAQGKGLQDFLKKLRQTLASRQIDINSSELSGEVSLSVEIVAMLKQSLLEKRKILEDGGPVPALLAVGLKDDARKELASRFKVNEQNHLSSRYKDYTLCAKNGLAFLPVDRFVFISLDGSEESLRRVIDTQSLPSLSIEKNSYYKLVSADEGKPSEQGKSADMFLLYLDFNDIAPLLGFYSAVKPEAKGIAHFVNIYRGLWIRISMGSDNIRARVVLEGTSH
ncbi:MAG: DUF3352 domain-containing protein [Candidatus Xenobiia bacterium LiM19]